MEIELLNGEIAIVDEEDYFGLSKYIWHLNSGGYVLNNKAERMHRLITKCPRGKEVDHINKNKLDNRKENLRICSRSENNSNRNVFCNNKSGYKGVDLWYGKYRAQIKKDGKKTHLGLFSAAEDAARAYDKKAKELFGKFASLNFSE